MQEFEQNIDHVYRGNALLKGTNVKIGWSQEMILEYAKCKTDIIYFIEKYIKIVTEDGLVPIVLRGYQKEFILSMHNNRNTICMMGRQQGKTESVRAFMIHFIIFNEYKTVGLLANKEATAMEILGKIQTSYENIPKWLQQGVASWNKGTFVLENGSRIIASATSSTAIRGYTLQALLIDEAAHIPHFDEFLTSVLPTISAGKETKVIMVSTPNGMGTFHSIWQNSEMGNNSYNRILATWRDVPGRDEKWRVEALKMLNNDTQKFAQEFECEVAGSSNTLISGWKLKQLVHQLPIHTHDGLSTYEKPIQGHSYVCIVDVSRGKGLDYSAFNIIDITEMPYKQVCVYRNNLITPIDYADVVFRVSKSYNSASVLVEINDIGEQVATSLHYDFEYDNLLMTESAGRAGKRITAGFGGNIDRGVRTTKSVKAVGCSILKLLIEQNQLIVNDFDTVSELSTFSRKGASYEAESGKHDDLVMGLVLFAWLSDQMYFKDLTSINTLAKLREKTDEEIAQDLLPFGFLDDGNDMAEKLELPRRGGWSVDSEGQF
jgi:hypothetical protein